MRNSNVGCFGLLALLIVIAFVWQAILYVGMPIGLIGGLVAYFAYRKAIATEEGNTDYKLGLLIFGAASMLLFIASAAGNYFTNDGPFSRENSEAVTRSAQSDGQLDLNDPKDRAIGAVVHHCDQGWRREYLSYEDCVQGKTMRERMLQAD